MTIGDTYILTSDFLRCDIGLVLIGESKKQYFFTPLLLKNNQFDNSASCIFDGNILTNIVLSGLNGDTMIGLFVIDEYKNKPSFLTSYCKDNKPFINLGINIDNIVLGQNTTDLHKIIIGGGTSLFPTKELFDKFCIQSLLNTNFNKSDLNLILKSK